MSKLFNFDGTWVNPDNIVSARVKTIEHVSYVELRSVCGNDMQVRCASHRDAYTLLDKYVRHCDEN